MTNNTLSEFEKAIYLILFTGTEYCSTLSKKRKPDRKKEKPGSQESHLNCFIA